MYVFGLTYLIMFRTRAADLNMKYYLASELNRNMHMNEKSDVRSGIEWTINTTKKPCFTSTTT